MTARARRSIALGYGLACHGLFAVGVGGMVFNLHQGMLRSLGSAHGARAWLGNILLLAQFPVLHSFLLGLAGRRLISRLAPREIGGDLSTTIFSAVAGLQLIAVFFLWSPSGVVWWQPRDVLAVSWTLLYAASWLFLGKALWDAGLPIQTGSLGWTAVLRNRRPSYGTFPVEGLFHICRQPVYLGFALTLWTGPVWTPDRLILALAWTVYCLVGPRLEERRYIRIYGERFRRYQLEVPYMGFRLRRRVV